MSSTQEKNATKTVETAKERSNMIKARIAARLSQREVAKILKVDIKSVINWEKAHTTPHLYQIAPLHEAIKFTGSDEELLQVFIIEGSSQESMAACAPDPQPCQTETTRDILESSDCPPSDIQESDKELLDMDKLRRAITNAIGTTLVGVNLQVITAPLIPSEGNTGPVIEPEECLAQCSITIDSCWEWLNQGNYHKAERSLQRTIPTLTKLATSVWPHQGIAASLAVQANIMQITLATRNLDFLGREFYCAQAVRYGEISGNARLYTTALHWQGNTYVYCYRQPKTAIPIFNNALTHTGDDALLSRSGIYSLLSISYAQDNTQANYETKAREYAESAHMAMPTHPELDPFYQCIQFGQAELDQQEGKMYLHLAESSPNSDYAQRAYDAFEQSTSKQAMNQGYLSGSLIKKADAARALGDMDEFVEVLTKGFRIGVEIDSIRRLSEAHDVLRRMPGKWQKETAVQNLQKDISQAIIVACR
jgi:transcriptional regulator with XRE-family HTH domain